MLWFLFIFLLHYDVFICKGNNAAKFNESLLLDKLHQNIHKVHTVLKEVELKKQNTTALKGENDKHGKSRDKAIDYDNIIRDLRMFGTLKKEWNSKIKDYPAKSQLSPQYNQLPINPAILRQGFTRRFPPPLRPNVQPPLIVIPRPPSGYRVAIVPIKPRQRLQNPGLFRPMHPRFLSDYRFQNVYLQPPGIHLPDSLHTLSPTKKFNQSALDEELNTFHEALPQIFDPSHFPLDPFYHPPETWISQAFSTPSSSIHPMNEGEEVKLPNANHIYVPTYDSEITVKHTTPPSSEMTTPSSSVTFQKSSTIMFEMNYETETPTVKTPLFFEEGEDGFLYVTTTLKDETTSALPALSYFEALETTTAGDVMYGKIPPPSPPTTQTPIHRYLDLVEHLDEGYMVVFILEFCRLIAVKNKKDVRQALYHMETIYNHLWNNGRLAWIDDPLQTVIWKLVIMMSEGDIEVIQTYASMMFHMLLRRSQTLSPEVNSILEKADLFYTDAEGEDLFKALMEFENFPNTTKSSYGLCDTLIESFLQPFKRGRQFHTLRRQKLLDSINNALMTRFPRVLTKSNETKPKRTKFQTKKRRKSRLYPHGIMRKRKKHRAPKKIIYGLQNYPNIDYQNSIFGNIPPEEQAIFRAMPSNNFRLKTTSHTVKSYSFNKRNRKLTHKIITLVPEQEKIDDNFLRNNDERSKDIGHHFYVPKTSIARHKPPFKITTSPASKLGKSSYFGLNSVRNSKSNGLHHFFSKKYNAHRPSLKITTSSIDSDTQIHLKRAQKHKKHYHQMKEMLKKSELQKKRDKLKTGRFRKISAFPTMSYSTSN